MRRTTNSYHSLPHKLTKNRQKNITKFGSATQLTANVSTMLHCDSRTLRPHHLHHYSFVPSAIYTITCHQSSNTHIPSSQTRRSTRHLWSSSSPESGTAPPPPKASSHSCEANPSYLNTKNHQFKLHFAEMPLWSWLGSQG